MTQHEIDALTREALQKQGIPQFEIDKIVKGWDTRTEEKRWFEDKKLRFDGILIKDKGRNFVGFVIHEDNFSRTVTFKVRSKASSPFHMLEQKHQDEIRIATDFLKEHGFEFAAKWMEVHVIP